jgi:glutaredoxin
MTAVVLYGRPGCHLCDEARDLLLEIRAKHPFSLEERDIEADDELFKRYLERIPVITIDGEERFELDFDAQAVRDTLAAKVLS